jgi:hypothetical protein
MVIFFYNITLFYISIRFFIEKKLFRREFILF